MTAISVRPTRKLPNGKQEVQAFIISNNTPQPLPTNGNNIIGMNENQTFAPFSIIFVTNDVNTKLYVANESGEFIPQ